MIGKIAAAMIGHRVAGKGAGAKGALVGVAIETAAKRLIPAIALIAVGAYAYKKVKGALVDDEPAYPSEASPSPPPSM